MLIKKILFILFALFSFNAFSQSDPAFDTLKLKLNRPDDSTKMKLLTTIGYRYEEYNNDSARVYLDKAIAVADKINRKDRVLTLTVARAESFNLDGNFDSSRKYLDKVSLLVSDTAFPKVKGYMLMTYADVFNQIGDFDSAISKLYGALTIYEILNDSLRMAQVYSSLGRNYSALQDYRQSNKFYMRAMQISERLQNTRMLSEVIIYMGTDYLSAQKLDSAMYFLSKAEKLSIENPDMESRLVSIYGTMGDVESQRGNPAKAITNFSKALEECIKFGYNTSIPMQNSSIAREYIRLKNYPLAKKYIADAQNTLSMSSDVQVTQNVYKVISEYHFITGNFDEGEKYFDKYIALRDSSLNTTKTEAVAKMEVQYETAKKDRELLKQKLNIAEKDRRLITQRITLYTVIAIFLMAVAAALLLYNRYKFKQQTKLDAAIIKEQQLGIKAVIEAQDLERQRISKELHDGVLQQLVVAKTGLNLLHMRNAMDDKTKEQVEAAGKTIDEAADDLRTISHLMMPRALEEEGLVAAVKKLSASVFKQAGISFNFSENNFTKRLSREKELQLYRVVQEIITNIIKHAKATEVTINLDAQNNNAVIEISDNGIGFDEEEAREKGGAGLFNIYSRIRIIEGIISIKSNLPSGSRFLIECPF